MKNETKGTATGFAINALQDEKNKKQVRAELSSGKNNQVPNALFPHSVEYSKENAANIDVTSFEDRVQNWENNIKKSKIPIIGKIGASIKGGQDAAGLLNLASGKKLPLYTKDAAELENINDKKMNADVEKWKPYIEQKIKDQFRDFNYNLEDIKGYSFSADSTPSKRIKQSEDFREILKQNKEAILKGERFSGSFKNKGTGRISNLHNAYGKVDFLNSGIDKDGNIRLYMFNTYDFNAGESPIVEAGRRQMLKGNLKEHFSLHEIVISKDELENL